jgi:D-lactate dehydrogenase
MGPSQGDEYADDVPRRTISLLRKAGYNVIIPENVESLCCGMPFTSKGLAEAGAEKRTELESALMHATKNGTYPVYMDMSPCVYTLKGHVDDRLALHDPVRFILERAAGRLEFNRLPETVAIHATCSARKMGLDEPLKKLAGMCAEKVVVPHGIECCGWAGDRGFSFPELNASALNGLKEQTKGCAHGYSTSRTCEIGMSLHSGIHYSSIAYLVDRCTTAKKEAVKS